VVMPGRFKSEDRPLGPTHIAFLEGPTDPEVGVLCVRDDAGDAVAALLHYTCHPVNLFVTQSNAVSADWPGVWREGMRAGLGAGCVPLVLNGCCGNINPWAPFTPDFKPDHRRMGEALTESSRAVAESLEFHDAPRVDWRVRRVPLPLKPPDPERVGFAEKMLADHPEPLWAQEDPRRIDPRWFRAASIMSVELMRRRSPELPYEIQAMRIGDTAIVGLPGEPFVEGQLRIKLASPAEYTFLAHCTTHYIGYVPTAEAFARGGHEVNFSYWAKLAPEALDVIVKNSTDMLGELFP